MKIVCFFASFTNLFCLTPVEETELAALLKTPAQTWSKEKVDTFLAKINSELLTASVKEKIKLTNYKTQLENGYKQLTTSSRSAPSFTHKAAPKYATQLTCKQPPLTTSVATPTPKTPQPKIASTTKNMAPQQTLPAFPIKKVVADLERALMQEPLDINDIQTLVSRLESIAQKNALPKDAEQLLRFAQTMLTPQSTTAIAVPGNELQTEQQTLNVRIETIPLTFKNYSYLKKDIEHLASIFSHDLAINNVQKELLKKLDSTFAQKLPEIETETLISSLQEWTPELIVELTQHIKNTFKGETKKRLLAKLATKNQKATQTTPSSEQAQPVVPLDNATLKKNLGLLSLSNDKQAFNTVIAHLVKIPLKTKLNMKQQKVDRQSAADCGYHALKNALALAFNKPPLLLTVSLIPLWKDIITERRATNPAAYPQQGPDWLEWSEIEYLYTDPLNLLKDSFGNQLEGVSLTISEDPFNMWHEFITLRNAARTCSQEDNCTHLVVIGTGNQQEITQEKTITDTVVNYFTSFTLVKNVTDKVGELANKYIGIKAPATRQIGLSGHWFTLVIKQQDHTRSYIVADSLNYKEDTALLPDRRDDPRVLRIINLFEALIHLYNERG